MASISDYIGSLPAIGEERSHTKKRLTDKQRKDSRRRAKLARKTTRKNRK